MAKSNGLDERRAVAAAISKAKDELSEDPIRLKRRLTAIIECEERLTESENEHNALREKLRTARKKMDGIREELRRVTKCGPDPQTVMPFAAGEEADALGAVNGKEAAAAAPKKKKEGAAPAEKPKRVRKKAPAKK